VVAATAAGVLHSSGLGEAVGGLVQQRPKHFQGAAVEAFAADQDLVPVGAVDLPAVGGEVAEVEPLAFCAGGDHQHRVRHVGVVLTDGLPGMFQGGDQQAGGPVLAGTVVGFGLHQRRSWLVWAGCSLGGGCPARLLPLDGWATRTAWLP
jgi:hypothetical protein